jgi:hypothetical protein
MKKLTLFFLILSLSLSAVAQDTKLSGLPVTTAPAATDKTYIVNSGTSKAVTVASLLGNNGITPVNPLAPAFGAAGNARHSDTGSMTNGSATLTCTSCAFPSNVAGMTVSVKGAGSSGSPLVTTVSSRTSSTVVTLAASASTTVSSARVIYGTNDTSAISSAASAAVGKALYLPSTGASTGYLIRMTASGGGSVSVPSNTVVYGEGTVYVIGSDGKDGGSSADDDQKAALYLADGSHDSTIKGLHFIGENGPYTEPSQNQSNVIWMPGVGSTTKDVLITECTFDDLFGFSVHNAGTAQRVDVTHCKFRNTANGLNVNSDYSAQVFNEFYHCEGVEASGAYSDYSHNLFQDCGDDAHTLTSMSIGGRTSIGDWGLGSTVSHNRVISSRGFGIVLADGFVEGQCTDNYILTSYNAGIEIVSSSGNAADRNTIARNTVVSPGHSGTSSPYGIYIANGSNNKVIDNNVRDRAVSSYSMTIGVYDGTGATGTNIDGNTVSAISKDFSLYGALCQFGQSNVYDRTKLEMLSNGSLASPVFRGSKALTNNTTTSIFEVALPTLTATVGTVTYRVYQGVGGEVQVRSGVVRYSAVNKAASYTSEVSVVNEAASNSSGTLSGTWSIVTSTNKIILKFNGNSSLFATLVLEYTLENESGQAVTLL